MDRAPLSPKMRFSPLKRHRGRWQCEAAPQRKATANNSRSLYGFQFVNQSKGARQSN
jgi:hypothetical protein